jgi:group II intron reverse transcriptase/maturase
MIKKVINRLNLRKACRQVVSNKGSAGVDGMPTQKLENYLLLNREQLVATIQTNSYLPSPILGIDIPKSNGKTRLLGIPTVTDRLLQQAVHQVIMPLFEMEFKPNSYGFRPNCNAQQAVQQAQLNINAGYQHIVDIDLKNFFDEVDHCILLQLLYKKVKCPTTLRLIRKWLRAPILIKGRLVKRRKGVPQGSPLSPLLSNILLHELDKELEQQSLRYIRYADDFSIYTKSKATARKVGNKIYLFLQNQTFLLFKRK